MPDGLVPLPGHEAGEEGGGVEERRLQRVQQVHEQEVQEEGGTEHAQDLHASWRARRDLLNLQARQIYEKKM